MRTLFDGRVSFRRTTSGRFATVYKPAFALTWLHTSSGSKQARLLRPDLNETALTKPGVIQVDEQPE